jgi:hypothetical protein
MRAGNSVVGPYREPHTPGLPETNGDLIPSLVRDGSLYLSLRDAIELAIEDNLDVEISRYNILVADTDLTRSKGGGNLRGIDYSIEQGPTGVGATTSPLLITQTTGNNSSTNTSVTDLSQVTQIGSGTQQNLSQDSTSPYAPVLIFHSMIRILSGRQATFAAPTRYRSIRLRPPDPRAQAQQQRHSAFSIRASIINRAFRPAHSSTSMPTMHRKSCSRVIRSTIRPTRRALH